VAHKTTQLYCWATPESALLPVCQCSNGLCRHFWWTSLKKKKIYTFSL